MDLYLGWSNFYIRFFNRRIDSKYPYNAVGFELWIGLFVRKSYWLRFGDNKSMEVL